MAQVAHTGVQGPTDVAKPTPQPANGPAAADPSRRSLIRTVSHELRTPLNAIIGFSEIISRGMYGPLADEYREAADVIGQSGHKLLRLVNQVLELAKLEGGAADLDLRPEPLDAILDDVAASLGDEAAARRIRATVGVPNPAPLVLCDGRAIRTALGNLVQNAVAFSPDGGEVRLTGRAHGVLVVIEVEDDGPGLDPAELPRLMEPFQQGETALTRKHQGAGLGWAIVRLLCQTMGGGFNIAAAPGEGLRATVALRRAG